jgi:hypothetical protein
MDDDAKQFMTRYDAVKATLAGIPATEDRLAILATLAAETIAAVQGRNERRQLVKLHAEQLAVTIRAMVQQQ